MQILDPLAEVKRSSAEAIPLSSVDELKGRRVAFVSNDFRSVLVVWERLRELLQQCGVGEIFKVSVPVPFPPEKGVLEDVANKCDVAVVGMAN